GCGPRRHRRGRPPSPGCGWQHLVPVTSCENVRVAQTGPTNRHRASLGGQGRVRLQARMVAEAPLHLHTKRRSVPAVDGNDLLEWAPGSGSEGMTRAEAANGKQTALRVTFRDLQELSDSILAMEVQRGDAGAVAACVQRQLEVPYRR